jgi:hypothetical protein
MPTKIIAPLFQKHSLEEIERETAYSIHTILSFRDGNQRMSDRFKRACCGVFNATEEELFGESDAETK